MPRPTFTRSRADWATSLSEPAILRVAADEARPRDLIRTRTNPGARHDYLVRIAGAVVLAEGAAQLTLHFVPDRLVAEDDGFDAYLAALGGMRHDSLEALATAVLEDVNDALVPRWVRVSLAAETRSAGHRHAVLIEDSQPGWENDALLSVLPPF
jgi:7-cyano-7-deazaguanine reductase